MGEFDGLFLPDAMVEVDRRVGEPLRFVGPHTIGDFIGDAISGMDFFEFVVLNTRIEIGIGGDPDAAAAMYMQELRHETESDRFTIVYGVYHDRLARAGGHWWFEHRRYHTLTRQLRPKRASGTCSSSRTTSGSTSCDRPSSPDLQEISTRLQACECPDRDTRPMITSHREFRAGGRRCSPCSSASSRPVSPSARA